MSRVVNKRNKQTNKKVITFGGIKSEKDINKIKQIAICRENRNIKSENKDNHLITVYYGTYDSIGEHETLSEDYYVNLPNSATSEKGFHTFLEEFLHMELPLVRTADGNERKL